MVFNQWTQWIISSKDQIFWHLNKITGNRANPFINKWVIIITQLFFFFISSTLSHSHRWLFHRNFTKLPFGRILWEPSLRKKSAGWLAQWSSSLATTKLQVAKMGKTSRRESQKKKKRTEQWFQQRKVCFPCDDTKVGQMHVELLKRSRTGF